MQDVCGCADQNVLFRLHSLPSLIPLPNPFKTLSPSGEQVCQQPPGYKPCLGSETNQANCSREAWEGGGTVGGSRHLSSGAQSSDGGRRQHATLLHFSHVCIGAFCMSVLQYMCIPLAFSSVSFHSFANCRFSVFSFSVFSFRFCQFSFSRNGMLS